MGPHTHWHRDRGPADGMVAGDQRVRLGRQRMATRDRINRGVPQQRSQSHRSDQDEHDRSGRRRATRRSTMDPAAAAAAATDAIAGPGRAISEEVRSTRCQSARRSSAPTNVAGVVPISVTILARRLVCTPQTLQQSLAIGTRVQGERVPWFGGRSCRNIARPNRRFPGQAIR